MAARRLGTAYYFGEALAWHKWEIEPVAFVQSAWPILARMHLQGSGSVSIGPVKTLGCQFCPDTVTYKQITESGAYVNFLFLGKCWSLVKPA